MKAPKVEAMRLSVKVVPRGSQSPPTATRKQATSIEDLATAGWRPGKPTKNEDGNPLSMLGKPPQRNKRRSRTNRLQKPLALDKLLAKNWPCVPSFFEADSLSQTYRVSLVPTNTCPASAKATPTPPKRTSILWTPGRKAGAPKPVRARGRIGALEASRVKG